MITIQLKIGPLADGTDVHSVVLISGDSEVELSPVSEHGADELAHCLAGLINDHTAKGITLDGGLNEGPDTANNIKTKHLSAIEDCVTNLMGASDALLLTDVSVEAENSGVGYLAGHIHTHVKELDGAFQEAWTALHGVPGEGGRQID